MISKPFSEQQLESSDWWDGIELEIDEKDINDHEKFVIPRKLRKQRSSSYPNYSLSNPFCLKSSFSLNSFRMNTSNIIFTEKVNSHNS